MDLGKPIIIVTLNYRVNVFGFMSSKELIEEATSLGETPVLNQGLNDQRLGLEWIQNSIHHFGGDAAQVTIAGESAGAASVLCHLKGGRALFKQAMIQSSPIPRLRTLEEAQTGFDKLVKSAGIPTDAAAPEKLAALRALSADQLLELFDGSVSMPIIDPEWFAEHNRATLRSPSFWARFPDWCSQVILGHTKDEAALFLTPFQTCPDEELVEFVHSLAPDVGDQVLFADGKRPLEVITQWATQESFIRPCVEMLSAAAGYGHTVYGYEIAVVDPFPGTLHGFSWHSFGVPLTFYQPPGRIYPEIATTQDKLSAALVDFFYGREPWEAFNVEGRKICWDGEQSRLIKAADSVRSTDTTMSTGTDQKGHGIPAETGMGIIAAALKMQTS